MNIRIIDFDKKYSKDIYELETSQWGVWGNEAYITEVKEDEIIIIALCDDKFAGLSTGRLEEDVFHLLISCIKPEFQKMGIGTILLDEMMKRASEKFSFSKFRAEAISVYGKCNAKKVLTNAGFEIARIDKGFWGHLSPDVFCTECMKKPCECDSVVLELKNKKVQEK